MEPSWISDAHKNVNFVKHTTQWPSFLYIYLQFGLNLKVPGRDLYAFSNKTLIYIWHMLAILDFTFQSTIQFNTTIWRAYTKPEKWSACYAYIVYTCCICVKGIDFASVSTILSFFPFDIMSKTKSRGGGHLGFSILSSIST